MNTNLTGVVAMLVLTIIMAIPLGRYMAKVYQGERVWTDFFASEQHIPCPVFWV
jgi:K+-transporting ATPase ATPase A chain